VETLRNFRVIHFKAGFLSPTETFVYNQIRYLQQVESTVFCRYQKSSPFDLNGISVYDKTPLLPWKLDRMVAGMAFSFGIPISFLIRSFLTKARSFDPSIIHAHFGPDGAYILPLARLLGVPLITSFYGYDVSEFPRRFGGQAKSFYRLLQRDGNCFLAMTKAMHADLISLGFPGEKIIVHHYGIDVDEFACPRRNSESENGKIILLQVGSLGGKKNQMDVLRAVNKVVKEKNGLNLNVIFVGTGPGEEELRRYVQENNIQDRVAFHGFAPHGEELKTIFERSHIFIHPSTTLPNGDKEGLPTTILEAMSSGLPIIATYHAGIPEAVTDGKNGLLVNEHAVDSLARAIIILATDPIKRMEFGQNAREKVLQRYDIRKQIKELEDIYFNLITTYNRQRSHLKNVN
jgi:glycosyltransferase involved in cell wall biosynthesis